MINLLKNYFTIIIFSFIAGCSYNKTQKPIISLNEFSKNQIPDSLKPLQCAYGENHSKFIHDSLIVSKPVTKEYFDLLIISFNHKFHILRKIAMDTTLSTMDTIVSVYESTDKNKLYFAEIRVARKKDYDSITAGYFKISFPNPDSITIKKIS